MATEDLTDHEGRPITCWGGLKETDDPPLATPSCSAFEAWWEDYVGEAFMVGGEGDREIAKAAWEASKKQQNGES